MKRWQAVHHPFTSARAEDWASLESAPGDVLAKAYDVVLNGWEIGGGSIRIHNSVLQDRLFAVLGLNHDEVQAQFGHLLEAFQYGAPPHGGIALGIDRMVALYAEATSIRDVIAFPKTQTASCLLTSAPSAVDERQLRELSIRLRKAGWKISFAPDAIAYTQVPPTLTALVRQRFRWERDALRLRYRKHGDLMNPLSRTFRVSELIHEIEFIVFHVVAAAAR